MEQSKRIFGLDVLRAIAIISVVIMHGGAFLNGTFLEGFPFFDFPDGVDLFFALSGFLIGTILLKAINSAGAFEFSNLFRFWKRRWWRTLPNYYLVLLLNYIVVKYGIIHEHIEQFNWKFLVFLQNFNSPFEGFFWESWTLTIEEWFYIIAPLTLFILLKLLRPKHAFLAVALLMIAFPVWQRIKVYNPACTEYFWSSDLRRLVIYRIDSIAYGLVAAWVCLYYPRLWQLAKIPGLIISVGIIYLVFHYHPGFSSVYVQVIQLSLGPLAAMFLLPMAHGIKQGHGILARGITHISIISYSMYLLNEALVAEVIMANCKLETSAGKIGWYIIYWIAVILFSSLLYRFYEKPMMDLRDK